MVGDLPSIAASNYATTAYGLGGNGGGLNQMFGGANLGQSSQFNQLNSTNQPSLERYAEAQALQNHQASLNAILRNRTAAAATLTTVQSQEEEETMARRVVQVFIADPDEKVPLDQALLYTGEQKLTELTDQELFFEIDIHAALKAHNDKRIKIIDKTVKDRTEYLEPTRVSKLKMVVVNVATL